MDEMKLILIFFVVLMLALVVNVISMISTNM